MREPANQSTMLRSLVKNATAFAVSSTRLDEVARTNRHRHVPFVLCYHRVVERLNTSDGLALPAMEISMAMLERHLEWLDRHFRIVSLDELDSTQRDDPKPMAAVTFDDGYSDIYHHAFPLLKRKGIPAGLFVVTDLVGTSHLPRHEQLHAFLVGASRQWTSFQDELGKLLQATNVDSSVREAARRATGDPFSATRFLLARMPHAEIQRIIDHLAEITDIGESWRVPLRPLTWRMLAEMREAGMTIGSHTKTHPFLTTENESSVVEEIHSSRRDLEQKLGADVQTFAYPGGCFNRTIVQAVAAAGYRYAFTICRHRDRKYPLLTIPRTGLWERSCLDNVGRFSPAIMSCQAAGAFSWMSRCTQAHAA